MAQTPSQMIPLGSIAPNFELLDTTSGTIKSLQELKSDKATVVFFICNHCPFVHHINTALVEVANTFQEQGVQFIAISSNDVVNYPEDSPEKMTEFAKSQNYNFPYLYDESQEVAKGYGAECTPDFFIYNAQMQLTYRGRFDQTRPNMGTATGDELSKALDAILKTGTCNQENQKPSIGCNIKWKS